MHTIRLYKHSVSHHKHGRKTRKGDRVSTYQKKKKKAETRLMVAENHTK